MQSQITINTQKFLCRTRTTTSNQQWTWKFNRPM